MREPLTAEQGIQALAVSEPIPGDLLCVVASHDSADAEDLVAPFLELAARASMRPLLRRAVGADGFVAADPAAYIPLEQALEDELASVAPVNAPSGTRRVLWG